MKFRASVVRQFEVNLGQVRSARRSVPDIERAILSLSLSLCLVFIQQISSHIDRIHYRARGTWLQKSLIRSLGFCEHYGRRWSIDRCKIANWKTLPTGAGWGSFGRDAAGKLETIPHLVIGPGAVVSTVCFFCNQETLGNLYVVITNSCHHCEIEHLASL